MRIALLKPDFGVAGGFEAVAARIEALLQADGHQVTRLGVDMVPPRPQVVDLPIPRAVWDAAPEYFTYLRGRDGFDQLDTRSFDAVISTQPPSFSHRHPRHLSVFYHHHRVYYDLEETYLEAGFAPDPEVHRRAGALIRELDQPRLEAVGWFLAGSDSVAGRLRMFNGVTNTSTFHAGLVAGGPRQGATASGDETAPPGTGAVLSVGRHEFPKRTELAVAAAHLLPHLRFALVGTGGREAWARSLDYRLATGTVDAERLDDLDLWCNTGAGTGPVPTGSKGTNVEFAGRVDDEDLALRYAKAPCVVAPAFQEDYGLTAVEAMAHGRPVVVCRDGGGLTELVEHERTGLVVEPTPVAIADAVDRLTREPDLAAELGRNAAHRAAELTWAAAAEELRAALDRVLA
ncbi:MAG: glycosyltransferase family 4 protein [Acidimicrobiales bacterium]